MLVYYFQISCLICQFEMNNRTMQMNLNILACTTKKNCAWLQNAEGYMRKKKVYPFPSSWIFFFFWRGYFWPAPDTGNWPVQLKCLQMTLSLVIIHTSLSPWLSLVKNIFPFIGSFLSLLSQGPCCLTTGREGERERKGVGDNASNERMGETK